MPHPLRLASALAAAAVLSACADNGGHFEADVDRSACAPSYSDFYTGAGALPVRCTAQSTPPHYTPY